VTNTAQSAIAFALAVGPALALRWAGGLHRRSDAAISGSIFADPDACFVMMMALPFGSTFANADVIIG